MPRQRITFFDALKHHTFILVDCLKLIMADTENDMKGGKHLDYAWQNWCFHFSLMLLHGGDIGHIESSFGIQLEACIMKMHQQLELQFYKLGDFNAVETFNKDCCSALERMVVGLFIPRICKSIFDEYLIQELSAQSEAVVKSLKEIQKLVESYCHEQGRYNSFFFW